MIKCVIMEKFSCAAANRVDLVDYLEKLGFRPQKIRGADYWYLSPLREEKTPSFKVNRRKNVWYDHGIGKGGTIIDFGTTFYRCSISEFLSKLENDKGFIVSFHPLSYQPAGEKKNTSTDPGKIIVLSSRAITHPILRNYLNDRRIPLAIANQFCHEVDFKLYGKKHLAIGFKNNSGGYELRNNYFKGSSTPKQPRLIHGNSEKELAVFEGFFSFLSFQTLQQANQKSGIQLSKFHTASLVLNSLSFFERSREQMEQFGKIHLFLDRDLMGRQCTKQALTWSKKYLDQSHHYKKFKDLNECLIKSVCHELKQSRRRGRHL